MITDARLFHLNRTLVSLEPSITTSKPEIDDDDESVPDVNMPNGTLVPHELTIAILDLGKD